MATIVITQDTVLSYNLLTIAFTNTAITACKIERQDPGQPWVRIRAGNSYPCTAGKCVVKDYEAPFDVTGSLYKVTQVTPTGTETVTVTAPPLASNGYTWLKDPAFPSQSVRLDEVTSLTQLVFAARAGVFSIIDRPRPVTVSAKRQGWVSELRFTTSTLSQRDRLYDLFGPGQVLLLAAPGGYGVGNEYVFAGDLTEERVSPVVTEPTRAWAVPLTAVDRPEALALAPQGVRWIDVRTKYVTWDALRDTGLTWDQLLKTPVELLP